MILSEAPGLPGDSIRSRAASSESCFQRSSRSPLALSRGELPPCLMLLSGNGLELAGIVPMREVVAYLGVGEVAHAAPQSIPQDVPLIGHGLALEVALLRKRDSLLYPQ